MTIFLTFASLEQKNLMIYGQTFSQEMSKEQKLASISNITNLSELSFKWVAFFYIVMFTKVLENKEFIRGWMML